MKNTALILIDIQKGFEDIEYWGGARNNLSAEQNAALILEKFRSHKLPVFHIKHCSTTPGSKLFPDQPGNNFQDIVAPQNNEPIIEKKVNSAFIGTDLKEQLDIQKIEKVIVVGLTTDHCISTSVRMAGNYGFNTVVISDATATFDKIGIEGEKYPAEIIHKTALASLKDEFATILKTEEFLNQLQ